jgi:C1A family cysteine protease
MAYKVARYGWIPDIPDARDHRYSATPAVLRALPSKVDLRQHFATPYEQGSLGSCTGCAIAGAVQFIRHKANQTPDFIPSRLFIYYNERVMERTVSVDSGAQIRSGIKSVAQQGVCTEDTWPYDIAKFAQKPTAAAYREAAQHKIVSYARLAQVATQLKGCLADGYPFIFGFTVYESFESDAATTTGVIPMPGSTEKVIGGHAVVGAGYDDAEQRFLIRNSWGSDWGDGGYGTMPYAYLTDDNLSDDFWVIRLVKDE